MKRSPCSYFLILFFVIPSGLFAQYNFRIEVTPPPGMSVTDTVYVAGSFNSWNPMNPGANLKNENGKWVYELPNAPENVFEFKFTRGKWDKVETTSVGGDIKNRLVRLTSDTVVYYTIEGWRDKFDIKEVPRQHTASENVQVLDSAFGMPQLNDKRRVWIYLPPGYKKSGKRYPVLYMHDGQNTFDSYTSGFGEWGADECTDSLIRKGSPPVIIVSIDNGPKRLNEYNPFDHERFGKGMGDMYLEFITRTLKPYIDKNFRTLKNRENTMIAGSSMGGLISYYAVLKYPNTFGKAGIFSPAFWTAPKLTQWTDSIAPVINAKLFFYMGELEGGTMVADMFSITERLGKNSNAMIYSITDPDGRHNEEYWRKWFPDFYRWITADGYNNVIKKTD